MAQHLYLQIILEHTFIHIVLRTIPGKPGRATDSGLQSWNNHCGCSFCINIIFTMNWSNSTSQRRYFLQWNIGNYGHGEKMPTLFDRRLAKIKAYRLENAMMRVQLNRGGHTHDSHARKLCCRLTVISKPVLNSLFLWINTVDICKLLT